MDMLNIAAPCTPPGFSALDLLACTATELRRTENRVGLDLLAGSVNKPHQGLLCDTLHLPPPLPLQVLARALVYNTYDELDRFAMPPVIERGEDARLGHVKKNCYTIQRAMHWQPGPKRAKKVPATVATVATDATVATVANVATDASVAVATVATDATVATVANFATDASVATVATTTRKREKPSAPYGRVKGRYNMRVDSLRRAFAALVARGAISMDLESGGRGAPGRHRLTIDGRPIRAVHLLQRSYALTTLNDYLWDRTSEMKMEGLSLFSGALTEALRFFSLLPKEKKGKRQRTNNWGASNDWIWDADDAARKTNKRLLEKAENEQASKAQKTYV